MRIFIAEKGRTHERRAVDAAGKANATPEFVLINPLGTVPVLELDDGSAIAESLARARAGQGRGLAHTGGDETPGTLVCRGVCSSNRQSLAPARRAHGPT